MSFPRGRLRSSSSAPSGAIGTLSLLRAPAPGELDDAALAHALRNGEQQAATVLWHRFSPLVLRLLQRGLGPGVHVEDALQETFLRVFRSIGSLRDPAALRSFVIGVALKVTRRTHRRRWLGRWLQLSDAGQLPEGRDDGHDHDAREALRRMYALLDRVRPDARFAFILHHVEGLDLGEVAAALGLSVSTVRRRLHHVTKRLVTWAERDGVLAQYLAPKLDRGDGTRGEA